MKFLAVIPARSGSKGLSGKNLRMLKGRPLLYYTISAAMNSRHISKVWVSSDGDEILDFAKSNGCIPLRRPAEASGDDATAAQVVEHFLAAVDSESSAEPISIVYLQPTSPLRSSHHIDDAIDEMLRRGASTLVSVKEMPHSPFKAFKLNSAGTLESLFDERLSNVGRQALPRTYIPNGAIYIFDRDSFEARNGFPSNGSVPYVMTPEDSVDIDGEADLKAAEHQIGKRDD